MTYRMYSGRSLRAIYFARCFSALPSTPNECRIELSPRVAARVSTEVGA